MCTFRVARIADHSGRNQKRCQPGPVQPIQPDLKVVVSHDSLHIFNSLDTGLVARKDKLPRRLVVRKQVAVVDRVAHRPAHIADERVECRVNCGALGLFRR